VPNSKKRYLSATVQSDAAFIGGAAAPSKKRSRSTGFAERTSFQTERTELLAATDIGQTANQGKRSGRITALIRPK
jgi:hypothetical protein